MKMAFQQKTLRKICGPVQENAQWRIHYNKNIYGLCKAIDVVTHIKIIKLEWAGHVCRMDRSRTQKKNLTRKNVWKLTSREVKLHVVSSSFQIFQKTAVDHRMENIDVRSQHLEKITEEIMSQNWAVNTVVVVVAAAAAAVTLVRWWW